jgi:hypothetical protein
LLDRVIEKAENDKALFYKTLGLRGARQAQDCPPPNSGSFNDEFSACRESEGDKRVFGEDFDEEVKVCEMPPQTFIV